MAVEEAKKRKACQSCTKAKAKCSPFEDRLDICYRCQRLKKECVFDDTVRKRGPKPRSRVKQLEHRVDTLIDLLANGQPAAARADLSAIHSITEASLATSSESSPSEKYSQNFECNVTPAHTPDTPVHYEAPYTTYDPVDAGLMGDRMADSLLKEYRESCTSAFPFVIIPPTASANVLRRSQPFLFHAIMTATSYRNSRLQLTLESEFKEQVASRIIKRAHRSLELLQGLLVFTAWYHYYYDPMNQQVVTMLQLCVAMVQDLGYSKNTQNSKAKLAIDDRGRALYPARLLAEERAYLGTYYLAASLSQVGRKRATMSHTRYVDQCCQHLASCQEYASDSLITPFIQLSALMCRVNDYFSYDDIENTDVKGEGLVQLSATNFEGELARLVESFPPGLVDNNVSLQLYVYLVDIWIHECSIHSSLWNPSGGPSAIFVSATRLKTLCRCLNAVQSYIKTVIAISQASLYHIAFPSWSAWCYAVIMACKLVFLEDDHGQQTEVTEIYTEVSRMVLDKSLYAEPGPCSLPTEAMPSSWNPISVARDGEILSLFRQMYSKMRYTLPEDPDSWDGNQCKVDPLARAAYLQRNVLCSFVNRLNEHIAKLTGTAKAVDTTAEAHAIVQQETSLVPHADYARQRSERARWPLLQNLHLNSMNFDSIALPENSMLPDGSFTDWLWNSALNDFPMPPQ